MDLAGVVVFTSSSVIVAIHLPLLEFSALTPPSIDYFCWDRSYGKVPMDRGIILRVR